MKLEIGNQTIVIPRPVAVQEPSRALEPGMSFVATVVFVHTPGFSLGDFTDSWSRAYLAHRPPGMTLKKEEEGACHPYTQHTRRQE